MIIKKFQTLSGALLLLLFVAGCSEDESVGIDRSGLEEIALSEGIHRGSTATATEGTLTFTVHIPAWVNSSPRPLVIALHGADNRVPYMSQGYLQGLAAPALDELRPIILAPDLPIYANSWTHPSAEDVILELIDLAARVWPVNTDRIVITGYSAGGIGAWFLAGKHPDKFSAAIPVAADPMIGALEGVYQVPFFVVHGSADSIFNIESVRNEIELAIAQGASIKLVEVEGARHEQRSGYSEAMSGAVEWLTTEVWD